MNHEKLNVMLGELLRNVPPPAKGTDYQHSLNRNRLIQQLMTSKALDAAEEAEPGFTARFERAYLAPRTEQMTQFALDAAEAKWPGFKAMFAQMLVRESEFMRMAGPQA